MACTSSYGRLMYLPSFPHPNPPGSIKADIYEPYLCYNLGYLAPVGLNTLPLRATPICRFRITFPL